MGRRKKIRGTDGRAYAGLSEDEKVAKALPREDRDREGLASGEPRAPEPVNPVDDKAVDNLVQGAGAEDGAATFMDPVAKKKRKYTKRQKAEEPSLIDPKETLEANKVWVRTVMGFMSDVGVRVAEDERARMNPQIQEVATTAGASCVVQYFPDLLGKHANAIVFCTCMTQFWANVWMIRRENLARLIAERKAMGHRGPDNSQVHAQPGLAQ